VSEEADDKNEISVSLHLEDRESYAPDLREFVNSVFSFLKLLALYDIENETMARPRKAFEKTLFKVQKHSYARTGIELKCEDGVLTICGQKISNHFSIVEALRVVPEAMNLALFESLFFEPKVQVEDLLPFFAKWALHTSVHQKPKALDLEIKGLRIAHLDANKANLRLKTKQLLMQPTYALKHYYLLFEATQKIFNGVFKGEILPQREVRRELYELSEIGMANPYQLVALSLIRKDDVEDKSGVEHSVSEAIANSVLVLAMAQRLQMPTRDQVNLAMAGLLYNVGLLSEELNRLTRSERKLSQVEYKRVLDAHSAGVLTLIRAQGSSRPVLERLLALFEATQGVQRQSISLTLESRLLRMVSSFVALTSARPYRDAYTPYEAMKLLGSRAANKQEGNLDPVLYYIFARFLGVYPMGTLVVLSNNERAVVYRPSGEVPGIPLVRKLAQNEEDRGTLLDLSQSQDLTIVRSLDPKREGVHIPGYFFE